MALFLSEQRFYSLILTTSIVDINLLSTPVLPSNATLRRLIMRSRLGFFRGLLYTLALSLAAYGARAQAPKSIDDGYCGHTKCRELAGMLNDAVAAAQKEFEKSRSRLRPHEVHLQGPLARVVAAVKQFVTGNKPEGPPAFACSGCPPGADSIYAYNFDDVKNVLSATKRTLGAGLNKNFELTPLDQHIERTFPGSPPVTTVRGRDYVEASTWDKFADAVKEYFHRLLNKGPGPINLHFTSTPENGARVRLMVFQNPTTHKWDERNTETGPREGDGWIPNLVPGWYEYEVTSERFGKGDGSLDLADDQRQEVKCDLQLIKSQQKNSCNQVGKPK
jgi:hypothetical protein